MCLAQLQAPLSDFAEPFVPVITEAAKIKGRRSPYWLRISGRLNNVTYPIPVVRQARHLKQFHTYPHDTGHLI